MSTPSRRRPQHQISLTPPHSTKKEIDGCISAYGSFVQACAKFDTDVKEEACYVLWHIWRSTRPRYSTLPACLNALEEDEDLYQALKNAHSVRKYDCIRNWSSSVRTSTTREIQDSRVETHLQELLQDIEPAMKRYVDGHPVFPTWTVDDPTLDPKTRSHLNSLKIPVLNKNPNLLLHDLGSFTRDPILRKRLSNIFMPNNHTFLVNTSGSGKTRLLLEGLCANWGFYFTSMIDSSLLGSSDVQRSIQPYVPETPNFRVHLPPSGASNYDAALKCNREIANRIFRRVLLARLIVFKLFAQLMNKRRTTDVDLYKTRWLLIQLQPRLLHPKIWDVFDTLSCMLSQASDHYVNSQTKELLKCVRELCACPLTSDGPTTAEDTPFFCVLDEAQYAATQHTTSFRSEHNGRHRPILREIVRAWDSQSVGQGVFMVVAGTGISKDVVDQAMASAIMKDSKYRWCSDTGAFDDAKVQRRYLDTYLPCDFLESESGKRLLDRIWYWLHGRYRFTTGYVMGLVRNGFRQPHRLLNAYVRYFAEFSITDAHEFVEAENSDVLPLFSQYKLDFSKLNRNSDMLSTIHRITNHYLMRSITPPLGEDEATYVEYGFARFVDSETRVVAIDEPLVLLAAIRWMNTNHQTSYKLLTHEIGVHQPTMNGFENYVAFCLDLIFSQKRRLSEVFTFRDPQPAWAGMEARVVTLYRRTPTIVEKGVSSFYTSAGSSVTLGKSAKSPDLVTSWLDHRLHSPFCFPHPSMGPDIMFVLELSDGSLIWVAVQTKWTRGSGGILAKGLALHAMKSVTPSQFFLNKNGKPYSADSCPNLRQDVDCLLSGLPNRQTGAGKYSLLRVVVTFPAQTKLKRYIAKDPDTDQHPIAILNMDLVKQATRKLSPQDFLHLQEIQGQSTSATSRRPKRKKTETGHGMERRKKVKLN